MKFKNAITQKEDTMLYRALHLDLECQKIISFVGAGGKTTFVYTLAKELAELGKRVIVTTTTHMEKPIQNYCEWGQKIQVNAGEVLSVGRDCHNGKMKGMEQGEYLKLLEFADFLIIEADGSRKMPLKVPAQHEPVIIPKTDLVVGVLGLNSVGKTIMEASHRAPDVAAFLKKQECDIITTEDLESISFSEKGLKKGVLSEYRVIWNQWRKDSLLLEKKYPVLLCEWEEM